MISSLLQFSNCWNNMPTSAINLIEQVKLEV
jgi:hypothetical protein